ncbi:DUF3159 domain-containing protein [Miniimonas sp. S16]|uniref:DUF3159 domain-containing protein n=1 Tax=Miniimonas sp. S16 TaxID=2171623 RepID=UPI001F22F6D3|nr:DUF3159 domain-containing protein [Miniimonas sp. S16]
MSDAARDRVDGAAPTAPDAGPDASPAATPPVARPATPDGVFHAGPAVAPAVTPAVVPATARELAPDVARAQGLRALGGEGFSLEEAVGGWRGLIESVAPGFVFVVVFVVTNEVRPPVLASLAVAAIAVVARLVRRSPVTYALGGVLGVGIGAFWAWRSGDAENYFAWGLLTNAAFALGVGISLAVRWPLVGIVVSALGLAPKAPVDARTEAGAAVEPGEPAPPVLDSSWRRDPQAMRRYTIATWLWFAAFVLRLAVQLPLYLGGEVAWLGTARLVMGLPLWALVLWLTWLLVRRPGHAGAAARASRRD